MLRYSRPLAKRGRLVALLRWILPDMCWRKYAWSLFLLLFTNLLTGLVFHHYTLYTQSGKPRLKPAASETVKALMLTSSLQLLKGQFNHCNIHIVKTVHKHLPSIDQIIHIFTENTKPYLHPFRLSLSLLLPTPVPHKRSISLLYVRHSVMFQN